MASANFALVCIKGETTTAGRALGDGGARQARAQRAHRPGDKVHAKQGRSADDAVRIQEPEKVRAPRAAREERSRTARREAGKGQ